MVFLSRLRRLLFGSPISSEHVERTLLPKSLALPVFASDAISSVVYASQQIMLALGAAGLWILIEQTRYRHYTLLLSAIIVLLLLIVVTSYWQTIFAYPAGGGSYTVSKDNLGTNAGLVAAGALLIDYVLTVSVSIAAGMQNLMSIPFVRNAHLDQYLVHACVLAIALLTIANLRGLKESGALFAIFTYGFVALCFLMIILGLAGPWFGWQFDRGEIEQVARNFPTDGDAARQTAQTFGLLVLLHAFANGCCALTGTEAVSNGIPAFREPKSRNAALTLVLMGVILGGLFLGVSYLAMNLHVVYWEHEGRTAPAVIDQLSGAVFGKTGAWSPFYLATQFFTAALLVLASNTSFADFPRLSSILSRDNFLPRQLSSLGDKLVFHNGIIILGVLSSLLIVMKGGNVDRLIPLYALGVFLAFTLSQTGMVIHWYRVRGDRWRLRACINGVGALATGIVLVDIAVEKFLEGAWIIVLCLLFLYWVFRKIHAHYEHVRSALELNGHVPEFVDYEHLVVVPVSGLHRGVFPALEYAHSLSPNCQAVYVEVSPEQTALLVEKWEKRLPQIPLVVLQSPYRSLVRPLIAFLDGLQREAVNRYFTVVVPEFVTARWWQRLLHGNSAMFIRLALASRKNVVISSIRYHLR